MPQRRRAQTIALAALVGLFLTGCTTAVDPAVAPVMISSSTPTVAAPTEVAPATPTATPTAPVTLTMARSAPVRVQIPAIGVDSTLMRLGLQPDGTLEVPPGAFPAGWFTGAPTPGELGPAVIAGHVDWGGQAGVFYDLRSITRGDKVVISRRDGSVALFRVTRVARFPKRAFPSAAVYGDIDHAGLRIATCGGSFDPAARSYRDNLVVFARLVSVR